MHELEKIQKDYRSLIGKINLLPGGYEAFKLAYKNHAKSTMNPYEKELRDFVDRVNDPKRTNPKEPYDEYTAVRKIKEFNKDAEEYITANENKYTNNTSWIVHFYDAPLEKDSRVASLGAALLTLSAVGECTVLKKDFSFEYDYCPYEGRYDFQKNEYGDTIVSIGANSVHNRYLNIFVAIGLREYPNDFSGFREGTFNQFDGQRIHTGRILMEYLGTDLTENEVKVKRDKNLKNHEKVDQFESLRKLLGNKSSNYLCAYNRSDDIGGNLWNTLTKPDIKFVDFESHFTLISYDFTYDDENRIMQDFPGKDSEQQEKIGRILKCRDMMQGFYQAFGRLDDNGEVSDRGPLQYSFRSEKFNMPDYGIKFFIHIDLGIIDSSLSLLYLGKAVTACKHVIFIYNKNNLPFRILDFLRDQSLHERYLVSIKLIGYEDFKEESDNVKNALVEYISNHL